MTRSASASGGAVQSVSFLVPCHSAVHRRCQWRQGAYQGVPAVAPPEAVTSEGVPGASQDATDIVEGRGAAPTRPTRGRSRDRLPQRHERHRGGPRRHSSGSPMSLPHSCHREFPRQPQRGRLKVQTVAVHVVRTGRPPARVGGQAGVGSAALLGRPERGCRRGRLRLRPFSFVHQSARDAHTTGGGVGAGRTSAPAAPT
jgi:hypothetical protein